MPSACESQSTLSSPRRAAVVSPGSTSRPAACIRDHGGRVRESHYPRVGHLSLIGAFVPGLRILAPVPAGVTAFAAEVTGGDAP